MAEIKVRKWQHVMVNVVEVDGAPTLQCDPLVIEEHNALVEAYEALQIKERVYEHTLRLALDPIPSSNIKEVQDRLAIGLGEHILPAIVKAWLRSEGLDNG